jgi:hypothetical protein
MATYSANFPELLEKRLREVYFNRYNMEPKRYPQVFNVKKSSNAFEDAIKVSGLGTLTAKPEGQPIGYDDPVQGTRKRTVHTTYALGFRVTMEMQMDDLYGIIEQMPRDLADATIDHQENLAWGVFNDAFDGTTFTGLEGDELVQTGHALLKSTTTYDNELNPAVELSTAGLESLFTLARTLVNESGRFTPVKLSTLLVPPDLEFEAARLLETDRQPGSNDNDINTMRGSRTGVGAMVVPYLTDTDAYFLLAQKSQHSLQWFDRMSTTFDRNKDAHTKDALFDVMYRAHVTFDDWRGVWGCPG